MEKNKSITYILIAILILAGVYWAYHFYTSRGEEVKTAGVSVVTDGTMVVDSESNSGIINQANRFIQILQNIDQVTLQDRALLSSQIFKSQLRDFGKPIEDRPKGRSNPFAPLGSSNLITKSAVVDDVVATTSDDVPIDSTAL